MHFQIIDNCPVPSGIAHAVYGLKHHVHGSVLQSCYRGEHAKDLLHRLGKHTQTELYQMFLHGKGNPANPPGQSTHEMRAGGVYMGPKWRPVFEWQVGMDWNDSATEELIWVAKHRFGWDLFRPFSSGSEYHHLNFRHKPKL